MLVVVVVEDRVHLQPSESALQRPLIDIMRYAEGLVKVASFPQLIVCFIDCVQQICNNNKDVDVLSISHVAWRSGGWFGIPSAYEDCVEY